MSRLAITKLFLKDFIQECSRKHILILASNSSFFFFLCLIPSTLLLLSLLTFLFESVAPVQTFTFLSYIESIVPNDIMPTFQLLFKHTKEVLISNKQINTIHYIVLSLSSLSFFGSVWKSIEIITEVKPHGKFIRTLKSFLSIALSFGFILLVISLPILYKAVSFVIESEYLKLLNIDKIDLLNITGFELMGVNFISTAFLFIFFIFFFRFFLHGNTNLKASIVGSAVFTFGVILTKLIFFAYLAVVKSNLISNYGSLYSVMIFMLWIFAVIFAFYFSIVFTFSLSRHHAREKILEI